MMASKASLAKNAKEIARLRAAAPELNLQYLQAVGKSAASDLKIRLKQNGVTGHLGALGDVIGKTRPSPAASSARLVQALRVMEF
jgi:hypothetical protein